MKVKMSREQRKIATFLRHAIRDYGIPNFDVNSTDVTESVHEGDNWVAVSYSVTVGANVVAIRYCCRSDGNRFAYVFLNGYSLVHCMVTCIGDMSPAVVPFARMIEHLN